jgi:hypothetical protein
VTLRPFVALTVSALLAGCGSSSPTAPAAPAPTLQAIFLVAPDWTLPAGGGSLEITVLTTGTLPNSTVPNTAVTVSTTDGTLSASHLTTDADGRARVTWTGPGAATISATAGAVTVSHGVLIETPPNRRRRRRQERRPPAQCRRRRLRRRLRRPTPRSSW